MITTCLSLLPAVVERNAFQGGDPFGSSTPESGDRSSRSISTGPSSAEPRKNSQSRLVWEERKIMPIQPDVECLSLSGGKVAFFFQVTTKHKPEKGAQVEGPYGELQVLLHPACLQGSGHTSPRLQSPAASVYVAVVVAYTLLFS